MKHSPLFPNIFLLISLFPLFSYSQADPEWLKSWNEANEMRPSWITSQGQIAPLEEPGFPMLIEGKVHLPDGSPAASVLIHAYHRDAKGFDFGEGDSVYSTWRLQGWVKTDQQGAFSFHTIRPAADHLGREGAHIHFTLVSEQYGRQWAPTVFLADEPLVTDTQRERSDFAAPYGWVREVEEIADVQHLTVLFRLSERADF